MRAIVGDVLGPLLLLATLWVAACAVKAAGCLLRGADYTFAAWDGGLMQKGKTLSPLGLRVHLAWSIVCAGACPYVALGHPLVAVKVVLIVAAGLGVVCSFVLVSPAREAKGARPPDGGAGS